MEVEQVVDEAATDDADNAEQVLNYGGGEIFYTFQPKLEPAKVHP
jgi:hypothetical protein